LPTALICDEGQGKEDSLEQYLSGLRGWTMHSSMVSGFLPLLADEDINQYDLHFIIYEKKMDSQTYKELYDIRQKMPFAFIIYYYGLLLDQQFMLLTDLKINSCIIGIHRKSYLRNLLPHLWQKHWKRIPDSIYPAEASTLPERAKKILIHIEDHVLGQFNLQTLSDYLHISQSHFRAEFSHNFGINFRDFKQRLLNHYESVLLLKNDYKPNIVYKLLDYSNLANLSRSFKKRHGDSWRNIRNDDAIH
jgi:YesN/AraC family two-component response regulator